jgi:hypothetical protein
MPWRFWADAIRESGIKPGQLQSGLLLAPTRSVLRNETKSISGLLNIRNCPAPEVMFRRVQSQLKTAPYRIVRKPWQSHPAWQGEGTAAGISMAFLKAGSDHTSILMANADLSLASRQLLQAQESLPQDAQAQLSATITMPSEPSTMPSLSIGPVRIETAKMTKGLEQIQLMVKPGGGSLELQMEMRFQNKAFATTAERYLQPTLLIALKPYLLVRLHPHPRDWIQNLRLKRQGAILQLTVTCKPKDLDGLRSFARKEQPGDPWNALFDLIQATP